MKFYVIHSALVQKSVYFNVIDGHKREKKWDMLPLLQQSLSAILLWKKISCRRWSVDLMTSSIKSFKHTYVRMFVYRLSDSFFMIYKHFARPSIRIGQNHCRLRQILLMLYLPAIMVILTMKHIFQL